MQILKFVRYRQDNMKLTYIYHSCFALETDNLTIIFDYFKDSGETPSGGQVNDYMLTCPGKLYVLSSHSHYDHFNKEILKWKLRRPDIQYILSKDILDCKKAHAEDAVFIDKGENQGVAGCLSKHLVPPMQAYLF